MVSTKGYSWSGSSSGGTREGRNQFSAAIGGREAVGENHLLAGLVLVVARVGDRILALQPLPRDALDRRHAEAHLGENIGRPAVIPVEPHAAGDFLDDPPVLARVARRVDGFSATLHPAIGVGDGAVLFGKRARRQDDIGEGGGLGEKKYPAPRDVRAGRARRARGSRWDPTSPGSRPSHKAP